MPHCLKSEHSLQRLVRCHPFLDEFHLLIHAVVLHEATEMRVPCEWNSGSAAPPRPSSGFSSRPGRQPWQLPWRPECHSIHLGKASAHPGRQRRYHAGFSILRNAQGPKKSELNTCFYSYQSRRPSIGEMYVCSCAAVFIYFIVFISTS